MSLRKYISKRNIFRSKEPAGKTHLRKKGALQFVVQKHAARRLHYDFRIEANGVLKSWAIPKGPSLDPKDKRLAIQVEDHPYDYKDFEGIIPEGYGAGTVMVWDQGTYHVGDLTAKESEKAILEGLKKGELHFFLEGEKLRGEFSLIRFKKGNKENEWLFIKKRDVFSSTKDITQDDRSVLSQSSLEEIGKPKSFKKTPKKKKPHHVAPMLATLVKEPFDGEEWIFEIKWDGFRALAELNRDKIDIYSRNFQSFNSRFPEIVTHLKKLKCDAILDGEIVVLDQKGKSHFQFLQNSRRGLPKGKSLYYYVFDLLYLDGHDLRELPLIERKVLLANLLAPLSKSPIRYLEHVEKNGKEFFRACVKNDLEGMIGKRKTSTYHTGKRTKEWVKVKKQDRQEFVVCGFTEPRGGRKNIGALIVGIYKDNQLRYAGHVGGGFSEKKLKELKKLLTPFIQKKCPFETTPKTNTPVTWVKPHFLCEVTFSEWTAEGILRQPIFLGLRDDKPPTAVVKEKPQKKPKTKKKDSSSFLTHLDKFYWPKEKITKGDLIQYYESIAEYILPYLKDRPQSLKRFPTGITGENFYQKNIEYAPDWAETIKIKHKEKSVNYLLIQDIDTLLYAANLGCIELHPFFSRVSSLDKPDFLVFDLDPEGISFTKVIETAQVLHEVLEELNIPSYCKTSGATGLHVYVPLKAKYSYEQAKQFAQLIAFVVHHRIPDITSLERLPKHRQKKVYIDCLQNNLGQTIAAPYSVRARPKAPVSMPVKWSEVQKGLDPTDFTIHNAAKRLKKMGDIFKPLLEQGISIEKSLPKIEKWISEIKSV